MVVSFEAEPGRMNQNRNNELKETGNVKYGWIKSPAFREATEILALFGSLKMPSL